MSLVLGQGVGQLLETAGAELGRLRRLLSLTEAGVSPVARLALLTDAAYAWNLVPRVFTKLMQVWPSRG